jgi:hypothetical protein
MYSREQRRSRGSWVKRQSPLGPYWVWRPRVPRVPDAVLDSVIYLYSSERDAEGGVASGGTGFLIGAGSDLTPEAEAGLITVYAVTARHVAKGGASVVRAMRRDTTPQVEILTLTPDDWKDLPSIDDVAVCPIAALPPALHHTYSFVRGSQILTRERMEEAGLGPGDEAYMVGRFIGHDGRQRNLPSVRFGSIAMMPWEPIRSETGIDQESFLVEMRSLPGYSGSPVFAYRTVPMVRLDKDGRPVGDDFQGFGNVWLLGIDWCHLPNYHPVLESKDGAAIDEGWVVKQNSGMAGVIPAWKLQELLFEDEELVEMRKKAEQEYRKQAGPGQLDVEQPERRFAQRDFDDALKKATRKVEPPKKDK